MLGESGDTPYATTLHYWVAPNTPAAQAAYDAYYQASPYRGTAVSLRPGARGAWQNYIQNSVLVLQSMHPSFNWDASLRGRDQFTQRMLGGTGFEIGNHVLLHELGHTFGLGFPETYLFIDNEDRSGIVPTLPTYDFAARHGSLGFMGFSDRSGAYRLNDFDAWSINNNPRHQKSMTYLSETRIPSFTVRVRDAAGNLISGASVQTFGSKKGTCALCRDDPSYNNLPSPLVQSVSTDVNGQTVLLAPGQSATTELLATHPLVLEYITLIVKVRHGNDVAGDYVSRFDVLKERVMNNREFVLNITLGAATPVQPTVAAPVTPAQPAVAAPVVAAPVRTPAASTAPTTPATNTRVAPPTSPRLVAVPTQPRALPRVAANTALARRMAGRFLLRTQAGGEIWYVHPVTFKKHFLGTAAEAVAFLRKQGAGITTANLNRIPYAFDWDRFAQDKDGDGLPDRFEAPIGADPQNPDSDGDGHSDGMELANGYNPMGRDSLRIDRSFAKRNAGRIFLQVERRGEAWYIHPVDGRRYFFATPWETLEVMKKLAIGIADADLAKIPSAE